MACLRNPYIAAVIAGSLMMTSTGAFAAASPAPSASVQQVNPWAALTALSAGAPAAALCGGAAAAAAVAAAQGAAPGCVLPVVDQPPPPAPAPVPAVEYNGGGLGFSPLLLGLAAIAAGALIYFLVIKKHHHNDESPT